MFLKKFFEWISFLLGCWLFFAPVFLGTTLDLAGTLTSVILGTILIFFTLWGLVYPESRGAEWGQAVIGVLIFCTPWMIGYSADFAAAWDAWVLGAIIVALALLSLPLMGHGSHERHSH